MKDLKILNYKKVGLILLVLSFMNCDNAKTNSDGYFNIFIPSEIQANNYQFGKIELHSSLDTLTISENDRRYTYLYLGVFPRSEHLSLKELKKQKLDTFIMLDNNIIPFEINVSKAGEFKLDGYISDQVILDNYDTLGNARIITNEIRVIEEINVTNN